MHVGQLWRLMQRTFRTSEGARTCVLTYHSIGDDEYSITAEVFAKQMHYLAEHATVVPFPELLSCAAGEFDRPRCAITFDDGYASVYEHALPILKRYHFPAAIYLTTGVITETIPKMSSADPGLFPSLPLLTWRQIRDLRRNGFTLGTHLVHHVDLTTLSDEEAVAELKWSRFIVEQQTDTQCLDFAYPWGRANRRSAKRVQQTGYRSAATCVHRGVPVNYDRMFIPRIVIRREYDLVHLSSIVSGHWDYMRFLEAVRGVSRAARSRHRHPP